MSNILRTIARATGNHISQTPSLYSKKAVKKRNAIKQKDKANAERRKRR